MLDPTGICNLALSMLGEFNIVSLPDDVSRVSDYCRANYDASRQAVLTEREWTFAIKRRELTQTIETDPLDTSIFYYSFPTDVLRIIDVKDSYSRPIEYVREGNRILAEDNVIFVKYICDLETTNLFSSIFVQTFASHMSRNMAVPLTGDMKIFEAMSLLYQDNLDRATASDSLQGSREMLERSTMESSRRLHVGLD